MGVEQSGGGAGASAPVVVPTINKKKKKKKKKKNQKDKKAPQAPAQAAAPPPADLISPSGHTLSDRLNPTHPGYDAALKARWKAMAKKERAAYIAADAEMLRGRAAAAADITHPFEADDADHAETCPEAYADIAPALDAVARRLGKDRASLKIYDPYYCAGAVRRHLAALGFTNVRNECEDFYARAASGLPAHDVLLTNPAYSGDHIPRLLDICCANSTGGGGGGGDGSGKGQVPFLLLMPNWVAGKEYFAAAQRRHAALHEAVYWWPKKRYVYWTPHGLRAKRQAHSSAAGNRTSPFPSFWYCGGLGAHRPAVVAALRAAAAAAGGGGGAGCALSLSLADLPAALRPVPGSGGSGGGGGGGGGGGAGSSSSGGGGTQGNRKQQQQHWQDGGPKKKKHKHTT